MNTILHATSLQNFTPDRGYQEFLREYFLRENNEATRFFPNNSITIDAKNRILTVKLRESEKNFGTANFQHRTNADADFLHNFSRQYKQGIDSENQIFNFQNQSNPWVFHPEIGGRIALTNISLYTDKNGEIFFSMPITNNSEVYPLAGKLSGGNIIKWNSLNISPQKIMHFLGAENSKTETNSLFSLQKTNKKEKIIEKISHNPPIGDWKIRFVREDNSKFFDLDNVAIKRSYDGSFEVIQSEIFYSHEDILSHFQSEENLSFKRPVCLVSLSDVLNNEKSPRISKIFYNNQVIDISDFPDEFQNIFTKNNDTVVLENFQKTPPLEFFLENIKRYIFTEPFRETLKNIIENIKTEKIHPEQIGERLEMEFSQKYQLEKNTKNLHINLNISYENWREKIDNFEIEDSYKEKIKEYILKNNILKAKNITFSPDFIYTDWGVNIMIEHKKSSDSLKMHQFITFCICKIFAKDFENTKYLEILSEYHSAPTIFSEDIYRMSEKDFENFFKNKSLL